MVVTEWDSPVILKYIKRKDVKIIRNILYSAYKLKTQAGVPNEENRALIAIKTLMELMEKDLKKNNLIEKDKKIIEKKPKSKKIEETQNVDG